MPGNIDASQSCAIRTPLLVVAVAGSTLPAPERPARDSVVQAGTPSPGAHFDPAAWQPPPESAIPADSLGASIRRGLALVMHTADSLPAYAPGRLNCTNCHINGGRNADAAPLAGSQARFPKYMDRTGAVIGLADRVNYCFTRSLAGNRLPVESREMQDILAYLAWLSAGVPVGEGKKLPGAEGLHTHARALAGDRARGATVFAAKCAACHGPDGQGNPNIPPGVPPLWGAKSFSVGASMARQGKAASFIWHNMPYGAGKTSDAARGVRRRGVHHFTSRDPIRQAKEADWPAGGTPGDVPYATKGHAAYQPPPLLPRANARDAIVPSPAPAKRSERGARTDERLSRSLAARCSPAPPSRRAASCSSNCRSGRRAVARQPVAPTDPSRGAGRADDAGQRALAVRDAGAARRPVSSPVPRTHPSINSPERSRRAT